MKLKIPGTRGADGVLKEFLREGREGPKKNAMDCWIIYEGGGGEEL